MSHRIAIDIDNVTLNWQRRWIELYQTWFGEVLDIENLGTWTACVDETHFETSAEFFTWFDGARGWDDMDWVRGAPGAIQDLARQHSIVFVTSRHTDEAHNATVRWFRQWEHLWDGAQLRTKAGNKLSTPSSIHIDDSPHVIEQFVEAKRPIIIFDQPWNKDVHEGTGPVWRARGWTDVLEIIEEEL